MELTKRPTEYTSEERRAMYAGLIRSTLAKLTPNCDGRRYSGQQIAYAKGRAWQAMQKAGF